MKKPETEQRSLGAQLCKALVASLWERHSNIGAKVPFQRFLCRDYAFFEHEPVKPVLPRKDVERCFHLEGSCGKGGSFGDLPRWPKRPGSILPPKNIGNSWSAVDFQWLLSRSHPMSTCWSWNLKISPSRVIWFWPRWKKTAVSL